jgi:dTDP-4-amino-4,6-dideoxygalactose transaminase
MHYKIPLFDLNFDEKENEAILDTLKSKWISTGPKTEAFEKKFAAMINVESAIALSNCTVSLHLALKLIGIKPGDEVICPSLTFVATANSIRYLEGVPVFADIVSYDNPTIDPKDIRNKITSNTKAILVMHYGGFPCNMDEIISIADQFNLKVIEDACHGPFSEYNGRKLGTIGDIGCFSFFSNKNLSTGEGGMLITNNKLYAERSRLLRSHGMTTMSYERSKGHSSDYDVIEIGYNYRMDDIRSSIGLVQLDKIHQDYKKRAEIRSLYISGLEKIDDLIIPFMDSNFYSSNYIFPIVLKDSTHKKRDLIRKKLSEVGIQTSVHYPAVHKFSVYKDFFKHLPKTEYFSDNELTLPMYSKLNNTDISTIIMYLLKFLKGI